MSALGKLREMDAQARVVIAIADIQSSTRVMVEAAGACQANLAKGANLRQVASGIYSTERLC